MAADAQLDLGGEFTADQLAGIANDGTIGIWGMMDNTGSSLVVGPGSNEPKLELGDGSFAYLLCEISGGTIVDNGSGLVFNSGTIAGVTYQGTLDLSGESAGAGSDRKRGLTMTGAGGVGPGAYQSNRRGRQTPRRWC